MLKKQYLGIIPARAGSKRLPGKNIKLLHGQPLINWTIAACQKAKRLDDFLVSTDGEQIAAVARAAGAPVPFLRPPELGSDQAGIVEVIFHCLDELKERTETTYENVVVLQPTSPLRQATEIDEAINFFEEKSADAVVSVCPVDHPPEWSNVLGQDLSMVGFLRQPAQNPRTQDLAKSYRVNGAIYICSVAKLYEEKALYISENIYAYIMDRARSVDIDETLDFEFAEFLLQRWLGG